MLGGCISQKNIRKHVYKLNSPGQRPEGVQDPQDGSVATATVTFTCILSAGGGTPPRIWLPRSLATRVFGVRLFPNSFGLIPELVFPYSRTRSNIDPLDLKKQGFS